MKRIVAILCALTCALLPSQARKAKKFTHETVAIPAVERQVIAVETENTALVLLVQENGLVKTLHYGAPIGDPAQYLGMQASTEDYNSCEGMAYPATGGRLNMPTAPIIRSSTSRASRWRSGKAAFPPPSTLKTM